MPITILSALSGPYSRVQVDPTFGLPGVAASGAPPSNGAPFVPRIPRAPDLPGRKRRRPVPQAVATPHGTPQTTASPPAPTDADPSPPRPAEEATTAPEPPPAAASPEGRPDTPSPPPPRSNAPMAASKAASAPPLHPWLKDVMQKFDLAVSNTADIALSKTLKACERLNGRPFVRVMDPVPLPVPDAFPDARANLDADSYRRMTALAAEFGLDLQRGPTSKKRGALARARCPRTQPERRSSSDPCTGRHRVACSKPRRAVGHAAAAGRAPCIPWPPVGSGSSRRHAQRGAARRVPRSGLVYCS